MLVVNLVDLVKSYSKNNQPVHIINRLNFTLKKGESCAITGASGSGKSTLLNIMGLLDKFDAGSYYLNGKDVSLMNGDELAMLRNHHIGFVFQNFNLLARLDAIDNVAFPLRYSNVGIDDARCRARELLKKFGMDNRAHHFPAELSGGQRQRVAIARALINQPSLILADEPTGNLDSESADEIISLLLSINYSGVTLVVVTHDERIARRMQSHFIFENRSIVLAS